MALKNYQYNVIIKEYDERQTSNRNLLDDRKHRIYTEIPEYKDLEDEIVDVSLLFAPFGKESDTDLAMLKKHIARITAEKKKILIKNGYPEDYLEPIYTCPDCKDTGYIDTMRCHCFKQAVVNLLYSQSNLQQAIKTENFRNFRLDYYDNTQIDPSSDMTAYEQMLDNLKNAKQFVADFDKSFKNYVYYGKPGLGKTFLSNCIANELLKTGHTVLYLTSTELIDKIGDSIKNKYSEENSVSDTVSYITDCDLLVIDDLGSEQVSEFSMTQLNTIINERLLSRRSTIISTNLNMSEIRSTYGERLFSRICGHFETKKFVGTDIRMKKKLSNVPC